MMQHFWTDETSLSNITTNRRFVTRLPGEEFLAECIVPKFSRLNSCMMWGSISGHGKGPMLVWKKEWGTINADRYIEHVIPLILNYLEEHPDLVVMEDNASPHKAKKTVSHWKDHGVTPIVWPPFSPDLNPIENLWRQIKHLIRKRPQIPRTVPEMQVAFQEAWEQVSEDFIAKLIASMPDRMRAIVKAKGGHIDY